MGFRGQEAVFDCRERRPLGRNKRPVLLHLAPWAIQRRNVSISGSASFRPDQAGGIRRASSAVTRFSSSLEAGSPGTIARRPPRSPFADASMSSRKGAPFLTESGPWQVKHLSERIGRTSRLNSTSPVERVKDPGEPQQDPPPRPRARIDSRLCECDRFPSDQPVIRSNHDFANYSTATPRTVEKIQARISPRRREVNAKRPQVRSSGFSLLRRSTA